MKLIIENETDIDFDRYKQTAENVIREALYSENFTQNSEISLTVTDDSGIKEINSKFRNIDRPTDVLSFPLINFGTPDKFSRKTAVLGDIVISIETALKQAQSYGHSTEREIAFLISHSMLHLLGYDHIENKSEELIMFDKQERILDNVGLHREHGTNLDGIPEDDRLVFEAYLASLRSYSPYSRFPVGACTACSGEYIRGCNIENSSYPAGICAERTAISKAVSEGKTDIRKIAVYSRSLEFTFPCGICLQVMSEFMPGGEVIASNRFGKYKKIALKELLPFSFSIGGMENVHG